MSEKDVESLVIVRNKTTYHYREQQRIRGFIVLVTENHLHTSNFGAKSVQSRSLTVSY